MDPIGAFEAERPTGAVGQVPVVAVGVGAAIDHPGDQRATVVEYLWKRGDYRAPWFWSLTRVLGEIRSAISSNVRVMSHPSGAGQVRGVHNCGACDDSFSKAVAHFSLHQDESVFEKLSCDCRERWLDVLERENFLHLPFDLYQKQRSFFMFD